MVDERRSLGNGGSDETGCADAIERQWLVHLHRLIVDHFSDLGALADACLAAGCRFLDMSSGIVSQVCDSEYRALYVHPNLSEFNAGDVLPLEDTDCSEVVKQGKTVSYVAPSSSHLRERPICRKLQLESYVGTPIRFNGQIKGTLAFGDKTSGHPAFSNSQIHFVEMMGALLSRFLERDQLERARSATKEQLRERREILDISFRHAIIGKSIAEAHTGRIIEVNPAICKMLGYSREQLLSKTIADITHPDDRELTEPFYRALRAGTQESFQLEKRYVHRDGHPIHCYIGAAIVHDSTGSAKYLVGQLLDISQRKLAEQRLQRANVELERLSLTDGLTGGWNRRYFDQTLTREVARAIRYRSPLSVALLDIDHFKWLNDDFGHVAGDQVLATVGELLRNQVRETDLVSRYGGEEFGLIMPQTPMEMAYPVIDRCRKSVAEFPWDNRQVTVSAGMAAFSDEMTSENEFLRIVDQALYEAKRRGRNVTVAKGRVEDEETGS